MHEPEILQGPFAPTELLGLLRNSAVPEKLRRYAHRYFVVFVDESGAVVAVARSKEPISIDQAYSLSERVDSSRSFFIAEAGWYDSLGALQAKIEANVTAQRSTSPTARLSVRMEKGERVLTIRTDGSGEKKSS